ncbi:hypothetical protein GCM10009102_08120 [Sphingomonas insulae]|uniref:Oligosaccharide repeat unit polymerase n=2 Tax=Sphingomonas insulae TaxID=424800 RepID=A0ABN1HPH9_9SPHN
MTNAFLMIGFWPIELLAIIWAVRRSGFLPFPHGTMLYLFTAQIVLALHAYGFLYYSFVRIFSTYAYIHHFSSMFLLQAIMLFSLCLLVPKSSISIGESVRTLKVKDSVFWIFIVVFYFCWLVTSLCIDWSIVWSNSIYLTMTDPEKALVINNGLTRLIFTLVGPFGLVGAAALSFTMCSGRLRLSLALIPIMTWSFFFALSAHSRGSAAYLILAGLIAAMFPRARVAAVGLMVVGFLTTLSVLWGRGSGNHGLASLPTYFSNIVAYYDVSGLDAVSNVYEGIFVTAEYFSRTFQFNNLYKILSFSPLVSFIDGYDTARDLYAIRLAAYVPNSAVSEVLSFGTPYAMLYFGVFLWSGYYSAKTLSKSPTLLTLGLNTLMFFGSYLQFAYDTRTNFRSFFYIGLICWFIIRRQRQMTSTMALRRP